VETKHPLSTAQFSVDISDDKDPRTQTRLTTYQQQACFWRLFGIFGICLVFLRLFGVLAFVWCFEVCFVFWHLFRVFGICFVFFQGIYRCLYRRLKTLNTTLS